MKNIQLIKFISTNFSIKLPECRILTRKKQLYLNTNIVQIWKRIPVSIMIKSHFLMLFYCHYTVFFPLFLKRAFIIHLLALPSIYPTEIAPLCTNDNNYFTLTFSYFLFLHIYSTYTRHTKWLRKDKTNAKLCMVYTSNAKAK